MNPDNLNPTPEDPTNHERASQPTQPATPYQTYQPQPQPVEPQQAQPVQTIQPTPPQPIQQPAPVQPQLGYPQPIARPGRTLSIVGFIMAFVVLGVPGLVLSIIGLSKSRKAGKADIFAILGIIFNIMSIIVFIFVLGLALVAFQGISKQALDANNQSNVSDVVSYASSYSADQASASATGTPVYPSIDPKQFSQQIESDNAITVFDKKVFSYVSSTPPSASEPNNLLLAYCGGQTGDTATGFSVSYWSITDKIVKTQTTGSGC